LFKREEKYSVKNYWSQLVRFIWHQTRTIRKFTNF